MARDDHNPRHHTAQIAARLEDTITIYARTC